MRFLLSPEVVDKKTEEFNRLAEKGDVLLRGPLRATFSSFRLSAIHVNLPSIIKVYLMFSMPLATHVSIYLQTKLL